MSEAAKNREAHRRIGDAYNWTVGVWKAVSILAVVALLGLWAAVMRRR